MRTPRWSVLRDHAALPLRGVLGLGFALHGGAKLADLGATEGFFATLGLPLPGLLAPLVGALELGGGLALAAGVATRLVAGALACLMVAAALVVHARHGFFAHAGGIELPLVYFAGLSAILLHGAGPLSIDARAPALAEGLRRLRSRLRPGGAS